MFYREDQKIVLYDLNYRESVQSISLPLRKEASSNRVKKP